MCNIMLDNVECYMLYLIIILNFILQCNVPDTQLLIHSLCGEIPLFKSFC